MSDAPWGPGPSYHQQVGGDATLLRVHRRFYARMVRDLMIGFHFRDADIERLIQMETRFTAAALGDPTPYPGRTIRAAHARHRIFGGQHLRRLQILREEIDREGIEPGIRDFWLAHQEAQREKVTGDRGSECDGALAGGRTLPLMEDES